MTFLVSIHCTDPQCTVSIAHAEARRVHIYNDIHRQRHMILVTSWFCWYNVVHTTRWKSKHNKTSNTDFWCSGLSWNIFSCLLSLAFSPLALLFFPFFFGLLNSSTTALRNIISSMAASFIWRRLFFRKALVKASAFVSVEDCEKWHSESYLLVCKVSVHHTVWAYLQQWTVSWFPNFTDPESPQAHPETPLPKS